MTGIQLQYWADTAEGSSSSIRLQSGESTLLEVDPTEKVVMIPTTRQQVMHAHIPILCPDR